MSRLSSTLTTILAAAIAWPVPVAAQAHPAAGAAAFRLAAALEESASVLGLESDDAAASAALTQALRKAAAKRGLGGGPEMSLVEMRLTMGCEGNAEACLAEGGKAIEVRQLVYGDLRKTGGGYKVQLYLLDVASAGITANTTLPLSAADLSPDTIDATAAKLVQSLMPKESDDESLPSTGAPLPEVEPVPEATPPPTPRERNYEWGRQRPAPRWKKIGLGVTAGVGGAALIAGVVMQALLRTTLRNDLLDAVDASNDDNGNGILDVDEPSSVPETQRNVGNNISRGEDDLCLAADERPNPARPDDVRNASVTRVCNKASSVETGSIVALAGGAVLCAAAIVFTVLLFVRKKKGSEGAAALLRHDFRLGIGPDQGGMRAGVGFRF